MIAPPESCGSPQRRSAVRVLLFFAFLFIILSHEYDSFSPLSVCMSRPTHTCRLCKLMFQQVFSQVECEKKKSRGFVFYCSAISALVRVQ